MVKDELEPEFYRSEEKQIHTDGYISQRYKN